MSYRRVKNATFPFDPELNRVKIYIFCGPCKNLFFTFRYGSATYKAPVATVLDPNGKLCVTLTYGKLLSRSHKIAYTLLNKALSRGGDCCLKPGDRIALVYPNNDPISFMCAFYGCLQAGIVPVPIEVPLTRRDAGSQQIGFLLGSCGIQVNGSSINGSSINIIHLLPHPPNNIPFYICMFN